MCIDDWFPTSGTPLLARRQFARPTSSVAAMLAEFHEAYRRPYGSGYGDVEGLELRRDLHAEEACELDEALGGYDLAAVAQELADVVYVAYGTAHYLGIPLDAVIAEVHAANMRKFPEGRAVFRSDGKVLKPEGWQPPDVAAVLRAHGTTL